MIWICNQGENAEWEQSQGSKNIVVPSLCGKSNPQVDQVQNWSVVSWTDDWCGICCFLRQEGIRGLWRGGFPTAQRAALVAGVQVFSLVILSGLMILFNFDEPSLYWHFCCSCQCMTPQRPSCLRMGLKMVLDVIWLQGFLDPSLNDVNFENSFSVLAGFSACIASNPVDVVRTRMMVQRKTARYDL